MPGRDSNHSKTKVTNPKEPKSFHLNAAISSVTSTPETEKKREDITTGETIVTATDPFTIDDVIRALAQFSNPIIGVSFKSALTTHIPIISDNKIILPLDNELLLNKVNEVRNTIEKYLQKELNNKNIQFELTLYEEGSAIPEPKKLYTAGDKFDHFVKINPALLSLKTKFGLDIE